MSVTNSNDELDADRDGGGPDNSAQSAPSPNETDVNEVEPTGDAVLPEDAVLPGDAVSTDTPASTEDAEPSDTSDLDDDFEPASGTALSDDPVLNSDPDLPNDDAPAPPSTQEPARASAEFDDHQAAEHGTESHDRNWVGYAAFATGALALSVVAIVLGHLGLKASTQGRAANRDFALAGLILGYIGLVATTVGVWFRSEERRVEHACR